MDFEQVRQRYAGKAIQEWERLCSTPIRLACYRGAVFWLKQHPEFFEQIITADDRACGIVDGSQVWYNFGDEELEGLVKCAGLQVIDRVGCEGLANHLPVENLEQIEADERYWQAWKQILLETCNEPSIIGISNHLLVVACKPAAEAGYTINGEQSA
jgi:hypothetical protein